MPTAVPRSFCTYQSVMDFTPAGINGASPIPRPMRSKIKWLKEFTTPVSACISDQKISPAPNTIRGPKRSSKIPEGSCAKPYDSEKAESSTPNSVALSPRSPRIASPATLNDERSRKLTIPAINSSVRVTFCTRPMRTGLAPASLARVCVAIIASYDKQHDAVRVSKATSRLPYKNQG